MKIKLIIVVFFVTVTTFSQSINSEDSTRNYAFQKGEWLRYRMSYSNFLNAGYSTIEVKDTTNNNKEAFHIIGV
ncbi:MAG: DUF3108 domain-containing protein, partial [Lutibacter sp.]|nr:DUF3108 domain-containing protein [Lutibacter sp.]